MFYHLFRPRAVNVSHAAKEGGTTDRWCVFNTNKIYPNSIFKSRLDSVRFSIIRLSVCFHKLHCVVEWNIVIEKSRRYFEYCEDYRLNIMSLQSQQKIYLEINFTETQCTPALSNFLWPVQLDLQICSLDVHMIFGYRKPYISVQQKRSICSMYTYIMPTCSRLLICSYMVFYPTYYVQKQ